VYTSGYFDGDVDFDPGDGVQRFTTDLFAQKNFLSKLDSAGNYLWAIRDINGLDIAADDIGNVYTYDSELTKYDPGGNLVWRKPMGGIPNSTFAHAAIKTDGAGNIYITGSFHYTQDFDPGALEYKLSTTGGGYAGDVFVCKLDTDGRFMWATSFGGPGEDYATSLAVDDAQNVYTTGVFFGNADFDVGPETYNLAAASGGSVFVHKMSPCKNIAPVALTVNSCKSYTLNNVTYEKSGTYTQILPAASGCDSIIQLTLEMTRITTNLNATTCNSYEFNGRSLTSSGFYTDTFQTASGCDSIVRLNLTITRSSTQVSASVCMGQTYGGHTTSGTYTDTFKTANGCDSVVTINLTVLPKPAPALGPDIELCAGDSITVSPGIFQSYLWQDGSVLPSLTIKNAGVYAVTVTNACGEGRNELRVTVSQCKLNFPSAFTPNGDGRNDRFALLRPPVLNSFRLLVYNRFGQLVFQTTDYLKGWTGLYKGLPAPSGTYVWTCRIEESGRVSNLKGTVVLLR
jgi:gliding motility-associated-like protein